MPDCEVDFFGREGLFLAEIEEGGGRSGGNNWRVVTGVVIVVVVELRGILIATAGCWGEGDGRRSLNTIMIARSSRVTLSTAAFRHIWTCRQHPFGFYYQALLAVLDCLGNNMRVFRLSVVTSEKARSFQFPHSAVCGFLTRWYNKLARAPEH